MAKKTYTEQERSEISGRLIQAGLRLFSKQGYQKTTLAQIYEAVGISKTFFYKFYSSKEELVIHILKAQQPIILENTRRTMARTDMTWIEKVESLFAQTAHGANNGYFIMTIKEQQALFRNLGEANFREFQTAQVEFGRGLLSALGISEEKMDPALFVNLFLSLFSVYNSTEESMPFLFASQAEATLNLQTKLLVGYLQTLTEQLP